MFMTTLCLSNVIAPRASDRPAKKQLSPKMPRASINTHTHTHTHTPRASDRPAKKQLSPKMQKAYVCIYTCSTYHTTQSQIQMSYIALTESPSARSQSFLSTSNVCKCSNAVRMPVFKLNWMSSSDTSCSRYSHADCCDSSRLPSLILLT